MFERVNAHYARLSRVLSRLSSQCPHCSLHGFTTYEQFTQDWLLYNSSVDARLLMSLP